VLVEEGIRAGVSRVGGVGVSGFDMLVRGISAAGGRTGDGGSTLGVEGRTRGSRGGGCLLTAIAHFKSIVGRGAGPGRGYGVTTSKFSEIWRFLILSLGLPSVHSVMTM
jgi:hypothetical protein